MLNYATHRAGEKRGIEIGEKRGREESRLIVAKKMYAIDQIAELTELATEEIGKLRQDLG